MFISCALFGMNQALTTAAEPTPRPRTDNNKSCSNSRGGQSAHVPCEAQPLTDNDEEEEEEEEEEEDNQQRTLRQHSRRRDT